MNSIAVFCIALIKLEEELYRFTYDHEEWLKLLDLFCSAASLTDDLNTIDAWTFNSAPLNYQEFVTLVRSRLPFSQMDLNVEILLYKTLKKLL